MKFVKLRVENFCGIEKAEVEFGGGLNVLCGRNELGKSTLAEAIRAALLLQTTSSASHPWVTWEGHHSPYVELVFRTSDLMYWRIRKTFGRGGQNASTLDESKDGITFSNVAKGRRADGELRKLLRWGIPEPGGQTRIQGMPDTFLTSVLLPRQDGVPDVFEKSLVKDLDESGKKFVSEALQALAAHPLFTQILNHSQSKYDEVFDAKGGYRRTQHSPFKKIQDEIKRDQEILRDLSKRVQESKEEQAKIKQLQEQQIGIESQARQAKETLKRLTQAYGERQRQEDSLRLAQEHLSQAESAWSHVDKIKKDEEQMQVEQKAVEQQLQELDEEMARDAAALKAAQDTLDRARSSDSEAERQIKKQRLENRKLELQAEVKNADDMLQQLSALNVLKKAVTETQSRFEAHGGATERLRNSLEESQSELQQIEKSRSILAAHQLHLMIEDALRQSGKLQETVDRCKELTAKRATREQQAETLRAELAERSLPDEVTLEQLRKLSTELLIAESALKVGLSVDLKPLRPLKVSAVADRGETLRSDGEDLLSFEAETRVEINIDGVVQLNVAGGSADARERLEAAKTRWDETVQPVFDSAGAHTIEELTTLCRQAAESRKDLVDIQNEVESMTLRLETMGAADRELRDVQERVASLQEDFDRLSIDRSTFVHGLTSAEVELQLGDAARQKQEFEQTIADSRLELAKMETQCDGLRADLERQQESVARAKAQFEGEVAPDEQQTLQALANWKTELKAIEVEMESLGTHESGEVSAAEKMLADATTKLEKSQERRAELNRKREDIVVRIGGVQAELRLSQETASKYDLEQSRLAVKVAASALSGDAAGILEAKCREAALQVQQQEEAIAAANSESQKVKGALEKTGGSVIIDRQETFARALEQKQERQEELELEYGGWKKLLETLREVETSDASHLGQSLALPITNRFKELTRDRYGELELGPNLESGGIVASGQARDIGRLSIGTRDQLSTIMRLALAEQIGSVLVLDDQLAQSDALRMMWFRQQLRKSAENIQILILTCRREDYLELDELPQGDEPYRESDDGLLRAVNLEKLVQHAL